MCPAVTKARFVHSHLIIFWIESCLKPVKLSQCEASMKRLSPKTPELSHSALHDRGCPGGSASSSSRPVHDWAQCPQCRGGAETCRHFSNTDSHRFRKEGGAQLTTTASAAAAADFLLDTSQREYYSIFLLFKQFVNLAVNSEKLFSTSTKFSLSSRHSGHC